MVFWGGCIWLPVALTVACGAALGVQSRELAAREAASVAACKGEAAAMATQEAALAAFGACMDRRPLS